MLEHWDLDLVIVDHDGAGAGWVECVKWIIAADPRRPVALLSSSRDSRDIEAAAQSGASGFLVRGSAASAQRDLLKELLLGRVGACALSKALAVTH